MYPFEEPLGCLRFLNVVAKSKFFLNSKSKLTQKPPRTKLTASEGDPNPEDALTLAPVDEKTNSVKPIGNIAVTVLCFMP